MSAAAETQGLAWRAAPPTEAELADPDVIGWAFRGRLAHFDVEGRPSWAADCGILVEVLDAHVGFRSHLYLLSDLRGEWCPVKSPSTGSGT